MSLKKRLVPLTYSKPDFPDIFCDGKQPLYCYKPSSFPVSHRVISMQTSPWTWSLGVTFEALLFWYTAYKTRNFIFEAYLFWFMVYKTRNITIGACLFPFMAFISYIYDPYQSSQIKSNRTDRTNRNILCPYVIMRCTLGMCSEYGLLTMLTVCTERTIR